jgi:predicted extracellular nuclease
VTLTKDDLKEIRKVVREEVKAEVKDTGKNLEGQIRITKVEIKNGLNELDDRMKNVEIRVDNLAESTGKDLKTLTKKVNKIDSNVEDVLGFLDAKDVELGKRILKVEEHLNLPQN